MSDVDGRTRDVEDDSPDEEALAAAFLLVYLVSLRDHWATARAPEAALVELLTFFPDDALLRRLGWKQPKLPVTHGRGLRMLKRVVRRLSDIVNSSARV
ncbi:hypothetical protein [Protaetiibacter larvae]|uniref:hypothetical protein n=1 Tax=Protaetiibacter larvae TaxID=2592654 RepID=UPI00143D7A2F|nr:hypothetical protein [Protaetiibacter larvae]